MDRILIILVLWPFVAAIAGFAIGRRDKRTWDIRSDIVCISECVCMAVLLARSLRGGDTLRYSIDGICGMGLNLMLDGFRCVYGMVAALMWAMTSLFARQYFKTYHNRNRFYMFFLMTFGATMGVFLSADLFSVFIFFEIMSFTSFVWVAHDETDEAMRAAYTYLAVAIIGGLVTLMGLFMLYSQTGTLSLSALPGVIADIRASWPTPYVTPYGGMATLPKLYAIGGMIAFGFAAKAGVWPMHIWLPKAHPVAPAPASALLSGILTKSGIFGILAVTCNMFTGDAGWGRICLYLGVITMFTGALLALFSVNLKRTLACSSMSQIGFIMTGIGTYSILGALSADGVCIAMRGTVLHMINHSMIKLVLFMAAGVIYMNIHKLDLNEIRGYGRKKPLLAVCFGIGAASISGIPLTGGYISKTLLHEAIVKCRAAVEAIPGMGADVFGVIEWIFLITGGMTLCYMLKLFVAIFIEKNNDPSVQAAYDAQKTYWNTESKLALIMPAAVMSVMGVMPHLIMNRLAALSAGFFGITPDDLRISEGIRYFSWESLSGALISITIGVLLYLLVIRSPFVIERIASGRGAFGRTCRHPFMRIGEDGASVYLNIWPAWLDLEELIYRPVILKILPGITGFVSAILSQLTDSVIILLRRTVHRQISTKIDTGSLDDHLAVVSGRFLDKHFPKKDGESYVPGLVAFEERTSRTQSVISGSLSFGLILVCIGLILVLVYILNAA